MNGNWNKMFLNVKACAQDNIGRICRLMKIKEENDKPLWSQIFEVFDIRYVCIFVSVFDRTAFF